MSVVEVVLREGPDVTPGVVAAYNHSFESEEEAQREALGHWFASRCFEMDSLFGLLEDAMALLALAWVSISTNDASLDPVDSATTLPSASSHSNHPHKLLAQLQREFDQLHLFAVEFQLTPTWTIQDWRHEMEQNSTTSSAKIQLLRGHPAAAAAASDPLLTVLRRGFIREVDLCAYISSMDLTNLPDFAWASRIIQASSPLASNAPEARYIQDVKQLVSVVLACCFGFELNQQEEEGGGSNDGYVNIQAFIECAWVMFETLPKVLPDVSLQEEADALERLMTGMEILASYHVYVSPKTLKQQQQHASATSSSSSPTTCPQQHPPNQQHLTTTLPCSLFASDLVRRCCAFATLQHHPNHVINVDKLVDDMLQLQLYAFPSALSVDSTRAMVVRSLLATSSAPSPRLRQLCPHPQLLVDAATCHFQAAPSSTSPGIALALTYCAWAEQTLEANKEEDHPIRAISTSYKSIVQATQWLEQCHGHDISPSSILALSPSARLATVQELLLHRPQDCIDHLDQLQDVALWLDLTNNTSKTLSQMRVWAAYAYLQTGHVLNAIQLTTALLRDKTAIDDDDAANDAIVAQVTSLALDLTTTGGGGGGQGYYEARRDLSRVAVMAVPDPSVAFLALLDAAKQLDAVVRAMKVLRLTDADIAAEKMDNQRVSISEWLLDQLSVHQDIIQHDSILYQQSLSASMQLVVAFATDVVVAELQPINEAPVKHEDEKEDGDNDGLADLVGRLAASLLETGHDMDLAIAYLNALPPSRAFAIWTAACGNLGDGKDPGGKLSHLATAAHAFFSPWHPELAAPFASLQVESKQSADLDIVERLLGSLDRCRFQVDHVYRDSILVALLHSNQNHTTTSTTIAFTLCEQYRIPPWELCMHFLESLVVSDLAETATTRDVELKKAHQVVVPPRGIPLLEYLLTEPMTLSRRLLHVTWFRVNPYDSIAWEFLWRVCLECHKRLLLVLLHDDQTPCDKVNDDDDVAQSTMIPVDRLKLFVACAKKLREARLPVHIAHFCGPATTFCTPADVQLAVQAAIPHLSGTSIKTLAMLLFKLHKVPASAVIVIYMDIIWTHESNVDLAYEATKPFLSGVSTDHVVWLANHFVGLPSATSSSVPPLYGHTFQSPAAFGARLTPSKRLEIVSDLYKLVSSRQVQGNSSMDVALLGNAVLWSALLALLAVSHVEFALDTRDKSPTFPFDEAIAVWCARGLSLERCRMLLQLTSALDDGRDHQVYFARHIAGMLHAHVPQLVDANDMANTQEEEHPLHVYLVTKWTPTTTGDPWAELPLQLPDVEPLDRLFCDTVLAWLKDVEPCASTVTLLKWLAQLAPSDAVAANHTTSSILSMLYDLHGDIPWKDHAALVTSDFGAVFDLALQHVPDTPSTNDGLAQLLIYWETCTTTTTQHGLSPSATPFTSSSWPDELHKVICTRLELDVRLLLPTIHFHDDQTTLASGDVYGNAVTGPSPDTLSFLTECKFASVALLSPFQALHMTAVPLLDWSRLSASHLELLLVRFSLQQLQSMPQVPWERVVRHCQRQDRMAIATRTSSSQHHALTSLLHVVVGFVVEDDFSMASRVLCHAANVHPMAWHTTMYEPLLKQFLAGWQLHHASIDVPRQQLVDKLAYLVD
ncbi:hypothetical protein DYB36_004178 [Aphanomyces astaci]|uniref:Uncharacterized protein n=1 Tax=Aphanomyces astaci TaxID=112090 RepID=A0A397A6C6_APHAT|nr:hypothetical protein DYB36_004178 [Aphanomyces astaci]